MEENTGKNVEIGRQAVTFPPASASGGRFRVKSPPLFRPSTSYRWCGSMRSSTWGRCCVASQIDGELFQHQRLDHHLIVRPFALGYDDCGENVPHSGARVFRG